MAEEPPDLPCSVLVLTRADGLNTLLAFVALCGIAPTTYIIDNLADGASDWLHHSNSSRPNASGAIGLPTCWEW